MLGTRQHYSRTKRLNHTIRIGRASLNEKTSQFVFTNRFPNRLLFIGVNADNLLTLYYQNLALMFGSKLSLVFEIVTEFIFKHNTIPVSR